MLDPARLRHPIVQAPMAGGPSTPALAAAVSSAGGLGFLAAGYKTPEALEEDIAQTRTATRAPFGVNLFMVGETDVDTAAVSAYGRSLRSNAERYGTAVGEPRYDDDALAGKLQVVAERRPAVVSFTFGCPSADVVARLRDRDIAVWVTVTEPAEAELAAAAGVDGLIAQGVEAGGHRGSFVDSDGTGELSLLSLLALLRHRLALPLIASGAIADGVGVAAVLAAGARAAQLGSAFMLCPEAGTSPAQRAALAAAGATRLTRAFTGRRARGIVNQFMREHDADAPSAYPHVHHLTSPLRAAARAAADPDQINLWAGETYELARDRAAGELVVDWSEQARAALTRALGDLAR